MSYCFAIIEGAMEHTGPRARGGNDVCLGLAPITARIRSKQTMT